MKKQEKQVQNNRAKIAKLQKETLEQNPQNFVKIEENL